MTGQRVNKEPHELLVGEYCKWNGTWYGLTPNGLLANLAEHSVIINPDNTITVTPSILVNNGRQFNPKSWHGYLENGVWREC